MVVGTNGSWVGTKKWYIYISHHNFILFLWIEVFKNKRCSGRLDAHHGYRVLHLNASHLGDASDGAPTMMNWTKLFSANIYILLTFFTIKKHLNIIIIIRYIII